MSTMKDVARKAGVSVATVSYVINGTKAISPATCERVRQAIKELNYSPDQTAKSFKTGRKYIIAFIVPDISNNYFSNIIDSLEQELRASGYTLIITNSKASVELEIEQLKHLTSGIVDGIVLASSARNYKDISPYIPDGFPVVLVDRKLNGCPFDIISVSDTDAIQKGMEHLVSCGHKRIGYIGDIPHLSTAKERLQAYQTFMEAHNLTIDHNLIRATNSLTHGAYELTGQLLEQSCTALVVGNNVMTIDACCYLNQHHMEYPDVQILGYQHKDLYRLFASDNGIIVQNEHDMGISAAKQILTRIQEPDSSRKEIIIYNEYIR